MFFHRGNFEEDNNFSILNKDNSCNSKDKTRNIFPNITGSDNKSDENKFTSKRSFSNSEFITFENASSSIQDDNLKAFKTITDPPSYVSDEENGDDKNEIIVDGEIETKEEAHESESNDEYIDIMTPSCSTLSSKLFQSVDKDCNDKIAKKLVTSKVSKASNVSGVSIVKLSPKVNITSNLTRVTTTTTCIPTINFHLKHELINKNQNSNTKVIKYIKNVKYINKKENPKIISSFNHLNKTFFSDKKINLTSKRSVFDNNKVLFDENKNKSTVQNIIISTTRSSASQQSWSLASTTAQKNIVILPKVDKNDSNIKNSTTNKIKIGWPNKMQIMKGFHQFFFLFRSYLM